LSGLLKASAIAQCTVRGKPRTGLNTTRWCFCFILFLPDAINAAVPMHGARDHISERERSPYRKGGRSENLEVRVP
ncbi:hypothetical protein, partial [Hydrogenophaga intermedia]|uniref:hypothetical protein n=1 Tax=Hydrogenophaga intermedia TaxID=65786 RepID=UPI001C3F15D2